MMKVVEEYNHIDNDTSIIAILVSSKELFNIPDDMVFKGPSDNQAFEYYMNVNEEQVNYLMSCGLKVDKKVMMKEFKYIGLMMNIDTNEILEEYIYKLSLYKINRINLPVFILEVYVTNNIGMIRIIKDNIIIYDDNIIYFNHIEPFKFHIDFINNWIGDSYRDDVINIRNFYDINNNLIPILSILKVMVKITNACGNYIYANKTNGNCINEKILSRINFHCIPHQDENKNTSCCIRGMIPNVKIHLGKM